VRTCRHSVAFLRRSPELNFWLLTQLTTVTMTTNVSHRFSAQSLRRAEKHAGLHVKCLSLFPILTIIWICRQIKETSRYQISWKYVQPFSSCNIHTDGRTHGRTDGRSDFNRHSAGLRLRITFVYTKFTQILSMNGRPFINKASYSN
jgi:hypothetical protein